MAETFDYKKIAPLAAYVDRIGAECMNFRRFIVKEHRGSYYVERSLIRILADGSIKCSSKEHAPTKEEAAAIKEALRAEKFPKAILAKDVRALRKLTNRDSPLYEFVSSKPGERGIIMAQERVTLKDGRKVYVPWTFFSDGEWRRMEPDGLLPFWKPSGEGAARARIMIHEGAKAAEHVSRLVADKKLLEAHPWGETLYQYSHWGMIGGALAPHRADYSEISREKPLEVVYVCDNDWPGKSALQEVAKSYGASMKGVMFDGRWPTAWDMADEMPKTLYTATGRYSGPKLKDLMEPATRATELVPNPSGEGRMVTVMKRSFREEWFHAITPEVYIHSEWPDKIYIASEFNNKVAPYSDADDTARLLKRDAASKTAVLKYDPSRKPGIYGSGTSGRFVNTHVPSSVVPEAGDCTPWTDFMDHLVEAEEDRHELLRWVATLVARPGVRMLYGVLMISETQGIGKGTLGEKILAPIMGPNNVSYPSENEIVESNFNYWLAHKRLAVVHEIYAGHSAKAYNRLKSIITDKYVTVSKKYQANYEVENWIHVFACSNSMRAIQLSGDDRRWFVPKLREEKREPGYWIKLNRWLEEDGGLGKIRHWAEEWLKTNKAVEKGEGAPWSKLKEEVVSEGYSPGMTMVANFLDRVLEEARDASWAESRCRAQSANGSWRGGVILLDSDLVRLIRDQLHDGRHSDRLEKPGTLRKVAKMRGWHVSDGRAALERWGTKGSSARLLCSSKALAEKQPSELAESMRPLDVTKLAQEWKL